MAIQRIDVSKEMKRLYTGKAILSVPDAISVDELIIEHGLKRYPAFEAFWRLVGTRDMIPIGFYRYQIAPWPGGNGFIFSGVDTEEIHIQLTSGGGAVEAEVFFIIYPDRGQVDVN